MLRFDAAPPIPSDDPRLCVLTGEEIELARAAAYVADSPDPATPVCRPGIDWHRALVLADWQNRTYVVWFCYLFEQLGVMKKPMGAVEELILEFRAPSMLDVSGRIIGALYAGAGAWDPLSCSEMRRERQNLKPHYEKGLRLLETITSTHRRHPDH